MKKIVIGSLALVSVVLLSSCDMPGKSEKKMDVMPKTEDTMMKDDDMMKKEDAPSDAMMKVEVKGETDAMMQK